MFLLVAQGEQTIDFGEGAVRYRECTASEYRAALRDPRFRDARTGDIDVVEAEDGMVRSHIAGWTLKDAAGADIPYTPANVDFVLANATPHGLQKLKGAIMGSMREAAESGKD